MSSEPWWKAAQSVWAGMSGAAVWADSTLVGVVARHYPGEGAGALTVHPVPDADARSGEADAEVAFGSVVPNLARPVAIAATAQRVADTYRRVARRLAPALLVGRADELAALEESATGAVRWRWYTADAFAGKTALLSWWVATHANADTALAACFLRRAVGLNTLRDVVSALAPQLAGIAGALRGRGP